MCVSLMILHRRPEELLCKLNEDTIEWLDVKSIEDERLDKNLVIPEPESSMPIIDNIGQWVTDGIPFVEEEK